MRSLDDSKFGAISRGSGTFAADGLSSRHTGHTLQQAPLLSPVRTCFHPSPATFTLRSVRQPLTPGLSGVGLSSPPAVFDRLSASETGTTAWVLPYTLYGQGDQKKFVHVRVCACTCACVAVKYVLLGLKPQISL